MNNSMGSILVTCDSNSYETDATTTSNDMYYDNPKRGVEVDMFLDSTKPTNHYLVDDVLTGDYAGFLRLYNLHEVNNNASFLKSLFWLHRAIHTSNNRQRCLFLPISVQRLQSMRIPIPVSRVNECFSKIRKIWISGCYEDLVKSIKDISSSTDLTTILGNLNHPDFSDANDVFLIRCGFVKRFLKWGIKNGFKAETRNFLYPLFLVCDFESTSTRISVLKDIMNLEGEGRPCVYMYESRLATDMDLFVMYAKCLKPVVAAAVRHTELTCALAMKTTYQFSINEICGREMRYDRNVEFERDYSITTFSSIEVPLSNLHVNIWCVGCESSGPQYKHFKAVEHLQTVVNPYAVGFTQDRMDFLEFLCFLRWKLSTDLSELNSPFSAKQNLTPLRVIRNPEELKVEHEADVNRAKSNPIACKFTERAVVALTIDHFDSMRDLQKDCLNPFSHPQLEKYETTTQLNVTQKLLRCGDIIHETDSTAALLSGPTIATAYVTGKVLNPLTYRPSKGRVYFMPVEKFYKYVHRMFTPTTAVSYECVKISFADELFRRLVIRMVRKDLTWSLKPLLKELIAKGVMPDNDDSVIQQYLSICDFQQPPKQNTPIPAYPSQQDTPLPAYSHLLNETLPTHPPPQQTVPISSHAPQQTVTLPAQSPQQSAPLPAQPPQQSAPLPAHTPQQTVPLPAYPTQQVHYTPIHQPPPSMSIPITPYQQMQPSNLFQMQSQYPVMQTQMHYYQPQQQFQQALLSPQHPMHSSQLPIHQSVQIPTQEFASQPYSYEQTSSAMRMPQNQTES